MASVARSREQASSVASSRPKKEKTPTFAAATSQSESSERSIMSLSRKRSSLQLVPT